jgi:two-component system, response regulator
MTDSSTKNILVKIGSSLKAVRNQQGLTQEELADRSGLHRTYITDVERGVRNITLDSVVKLVRALGIPLSELFARVEGRVAVSPTALPGALDDKPFEILLVEDDARHVEQTLHALEKNGVTNPLIVVHTGEEALDVLGAGGQFLHRNTSPLPRIVLLDLSLPTVSGIDVLRRIRADERTRALPVVILTSSRNDQDYKESLKLGVIAAISKPIDFGEFSTVIPRIGFRWRVVDAR